MSTAVLDGLLVALASLGFTTWFGGVPAGLAPGAVWAVLAAVLAARVAVDPPPRPRPLPETWACLGLAAAYRAPALVHPWAWVNKDGAYGGFVALHILQGQRPVSPFTEGAHYQGTLKSHIAAALSPVSADLSFLMVASSVLLSLVFLVATMALARRVGGRVAGAVAGAYVALGPKFPTVFGLNCVGQYVDVLALGGVALAWLAAELDAPTTGSRARGRWLGIGFALGAAFWQQPVAVCYAAVVILVLVARRATWRAPHAVFAVWGAAVGVVPVLVWNYRNGWGTEEILERNLITPFEILAGLPDQVFRTVTISFPILMGLSPGHPWALVPGLAEATAALPLLLAAAYVWLRRVELIGGLRRGAPTASLLPPLLLTCCLGIFWTMPAEWIHYRPRYLLPVTAATAIHLGVVAAAGWRRQRLLTGVAVAGIVALHMTGMVPRLQAGAGVEAYYRNLVEGLDEKGIRTGYADFSIAAPVTLFTSERITLSPELGPTPAHVSPVQARRVAERGPDAYVLLPDEDPRPFRRAFRKLSVRYAFDAAPVPVFYDLSRRASLKDLRKVLHAVRPTPIEDE